MANVVLEIRMMKDVVPPYRRSGHELFFSRDNYDYDNDDHTDCEEECCLYCRCCSDELARDCECEHSMWEECFTCVCCDRLEVNCECEHGTDEYCPSDEEDDE